TRRWAAGCGCRSGPRSSTARSVPACRTHSAGSPADARTTHGRGASAPPPILMRRTAATGRRSEGIHMAELTIRPEEIRAALDSFVDSYEPATAVSEEVGRVSVAGDGVARVEGLPGAMANELLRFEDGTMGLALNLDVREIGVVVLGEFAGIEE